MDYFSNLPTINYLFDDQYAKVKNIFYSLKVEFVNRDQLSVYRINGIKRLDTISHELYGTTDYWWLIALVNDFKDIIFDLPVEEDILREISLRRTLELFNSLNDTGASDYYIEQFDSLVVLNDEKRVIEVISTSQIGSVISEITKRL